MTPRAPDPHFDPYAALRVPRFCTYFVCNMVAILGMQMLTTAVGWDIYSRTKSQLALGYVGLIQFLPSVVLALISGHVADRIPRQRVLAVAVSTVAAASLGLTWIAGSQLDDRLIFLCLLVIGIARAFVGPAKASLLPQLVPNELFSNAVTWQTTGFQLSSVLGPPMAGLMIYWSNSAVYVYLFDVLAALSFVVMIVCLDLPRAAATQHAPSLREMVAGFTFVRQNQIILGAISLDMFAVLLGGATTLLPVFAEDILRTGPQGLGWMRAAPAIGALVTAVILAHRPPMARAGRALLWSIVGFGVATIVFGLSTNYYLSLSMLFLTGAFDNVSVVIRHTLIQTLTPNAIRGRVSAVNGLFIGASNELGGFESGVVAHYFGAMASVVSGGIGTIGVVLLTAWGMPRLRDYGRLGSEVASEPETPSTAQPPTRVPQPDPTPAP